MKLLPTWSIVIILAISCNKEQSPNTAPITGSQSSAAYINPLTTDADFIAYYEASKPVMSHVRYWQAVPPELADSILTFDECNAVAPLLGFADSAALVNYIITSSVQAKRVQAQYGTLSIDMVTGAMNEIDNGGSTGGGQTFLPVGPGEDDDLQACYANAAGQYVSVSMGCLGLLTVPVAGEVLAGTCWIGCLIQYDAQLRMCDRMFKNPNNP